MPILKIDQVKFTKALEKSVTDKNLALIALNVFNIKLGTGSNSFASTILGGQATWKALVEEYRDRKAREGHDTRAWVRTGKLLGAISQPATKIGITKGVSISFKKNSKIGRLEIAGAIGSDTGKKVGKPEKNEILYRNNYYRNLVEWTAADKAEVEQTAAKVMADIFRREGL